MRTENIDLYTVVDNQLFVSKVVPDKEFYTAQSMVLEIKNEPQDEEDIIEVVSTDKALSALDTLSEFFEANPMDLEFYHHYSKLKEMVNEYIFKT